MIGVGPSGVHNIGPNTGRRKPLGSMHPEGQIHTRLVARQLCVLGESSSSAATLVTMTPGDEVRFEYQGRAVVVWKRRVHQWRTDLMIRVDGREAYLARDEGGLTRGDVKRMALEWVQKDGRILKGL